MITEIFNYKVSEYKIINIDYLSIVFNLTLLNGFGIEEVRIYNKPSWSVSIEFWTYVIFSIFAFYKIYNKYILGLIIIGCIYYLKDTSLMQSIYNFDALFRCLYGFTIGIIISKIKNIDLKFINIYQILIVLLMYYMWINVEMYEKILPFIFGLLIFIIKNDKGIIAKVLCNKYIQELGKISYSMYMLHFIILIYFNAVINNIADKYKNLTLIAFIMTVIIISKIAYYKIEEPMIKYFK